MIRSLAYLKEMSIGNTSGTVVVPKLMPRTTITMKKETFSPQQLRVASYIDICVCCKTLDTDTRLTDGEGLWRVSIEITLHTGKRVVPIESGIAGACYEEIAMSPPVSNNGAAGNVHFLRGSPTHFFNVP